MDITRTTAPGVGVVHQFTTRDGQQFGVVVDKKGRRLLLVYDAADPDAPGHTIVLEPDEADQLAEVLHTRSIPDRLAALERRLDELTRNRS